LQGSVAAHFPVQGIGVFEMRTPIQYELLHATTAAAPAKKSLSTELGTLRDGGRRRSMFEWNHLDYPADLAVLIAVRSTHAADMVMFHCNMRSNAPLSARSELSRSFESAPGGEPS